MLVTIALWLGGAATIHAAFMEDWARMKSIQPQGYVCRHTTGAIRIDGKLDEADWQNAPWTSDFADIQGDTRPKPSFRTHVKMLWDAQYFYVAAELEEPHVWGTLTNHDAVIFRDNDFEVFIDPNGDSHEYYEIEINALNTEWDLLLKKPYKDGGPALNEWEIPGLKTAVHVEGTINQPADVDKGWCVEIAFPWKALASYARRPTPPHEADQWRINFSRVEWETTIVNGHYQKVPGKPEDNWVWSPQGIIDMHRPEKWGYVQFTRNSGEAAFVPDPSRPARDALQEIYYAQRDYQTNHHHWATSLEQLKLGPDLKLPGLMRTPTMALTKDGFEASAQLQLPNGRTQSWHIRQDARVWSK